MSEKEARRYIKTFEEARAGWIEILIKYPDSVEAAQHILSCNNKIEFIRILGNAWGDEEPLDDRE